MSWSKPALVSVVSRIRLVAAAVAAVIMSFADPGRPFAIAATARRACTPAMPTFYGWTGRLDKIASTRTARAWRCAVFRALDADQEFHRRNRRDGGIVKADDRVHVEPAALDRDEDAGVEDYRLAIRVPRR